MTFYVVTFVGRVDDSGKPVIDPVEGKPSVRELPVWDERSLDEVIAAYRSEGVVKTQKLGTRNAPGRPLEHRGELAIFAPHLIAIKLDVRASGKQPYGPLPFELRQP